MFPRTLKTRYAWQSDPAVRAFLHWVLTALCVLLGAGASRQVCAAMWKEVGHPGATPTDKVFIDLDSIAQNGDYRQAVLMTVYERPRLNSNQLLLDRHNQTEAFDCTGRRISGMETTGYLQGQPVGRSYANPDWKNQFRSLPADPFSNTVFDLVCTARAIPNAVRKPPYPTDSRPSAPAGDVFGGINSSVNGGMNGPTDTGNNHGSSSGTGLAVSADGLILTNHHVVNGCGQLLVRNGDGQASGATVEALDPRIDLALVRSSIRFRDVARFRTESRPARLGEFAGVIGYPLTGFLSTDPKATFGEVTSVSGPGNNPSLLQISAPVQPGNSGSPVLDASGSVIGVVVAEAAMSVAVMAGNMPQNVNFAIRGELAQDFLRDHGIQYQTVNLHDKLATEDVADQGQKIAVLIVCRRTP